jgi:hypothetical protein
MTNVIQVSRRIIPVEHVALVEPFVSDANAPLRSAREFKSRIVLLDKDSVLSEDTPAQLAKAHAFRMIAADQVATNPVVAY